MATSNCKKKVKPGAITLHGIDAALLIDIETQLINADDEIVNKTASQKRIELDAYLTASSLTAAATEIVTNCKYIHKSKVAHVEGLLRQCLERQQRKAAQHQQKAAQLQQKATVEVAPTAAIVTRPAAAAAPLPVEPISDKSDSESDCDEKISRPETGQRKKPPPPPARRKKELATDPEPPRDGEPRTPVKPKRPKEKASIDQLDTYLELLYEENIEEVVRSTGLLAQLARSHEHLDVLCANGTAIGALTRILNENRKKNADLVANVLDIFRSISRYSPLHAILLSSKIGDTTMKILDLECKRYDLHHNEPSEKSAPRFYSKQHKILSLAFTILLNLAEDVQIEVKMVNRGIISYLLSTLARDAKEASRSLTDLQLLVLQFLKKLSIMKENVNSMAESNLVSVLTGLKAFTSPAVTTAVLRLLFNLSFHPVIRELILKDSALIATAADGLRSEDEMSQQAALRFLYNLSVYSKGRIAVASDARVVNKVTDMIIKSPVRQIPGDLIGLAINLSTFDKAAAIMCEKETLSALVKRSLTTNDVLLMKLLHNLSVHPNKGKEHLSRYLADFISLAKRSQRNEFLVETLGIIGNLNQADASFARVVTHSDFIDFLVKHLIPGFTDDDVVLAVVIIVGTLGSDPLCAPILANSRLVRLLVDTLTEKSDDEEIVLQTTFSIYILMCYDEIRPLLLAIPTLMEKLIYIHKSDTNASVQDIAAQCIMIALVQGSEADRNQLKHSIFELHNYEWLRTSSASNTDADRPDSSFSENRGESYGWNSREPSPVGQWSDQHHPDSQDDYCDELY